MCTHPNFTIVAYCPHWWERNQEGWVVQCRSCKVLFHRWRPPLPEPNPYPFEWLKPPQVSEDEMAGLIQAEREGCLVSRKEGSGI